VRLAQHRRATVVLALLVAVAVGVSLAAVAGARRTDAALPEMLRHHHAADAIVTFVPPQFGAKTSRDLVPEAAAIRRIPDVREAKRFTNGIVALPPRGTGYGGSHVLASIAVDDGGLWAVGHPYVLAGRLPDDHRADQVAVDEELARDAHLHVGARLPVRAFTFAQADQILDPSAPPKGERVDATVTAIVRQPSDLRDLSAPRNADNIFQVHYDLYLTAAFWSAAHADVFGYNPSVAVALRDGAAGVATFRHQVPTAVHNAPDILSSDDFLAGAGTLQGVTHAVTVQSRSLQAFGALAALVGLFLVGQTVGRQTRFEASDDEGLRAIGVTDGQRRMALLVRIAVVTAVGTAAGVALAIALSPLAPLPGSTARRALLHPGVSADRTVLAGGALLAAVAIVGVGLLTAWRRPGPVSVAVRPPLADRLGVIGLPGPQTIGMRFALEPGRGGRAVPVRAALVASIVAVVVALAATVFGSSLDQLRHDPQLYGVTWDVSVGGAATPGEAAADLAKLRRIPGLQGYSAMNETALDIAGHQVPTMAVRADHGRVVPTIVEGRAPIAKDEIVLGADTMHATGAGIGDHVRVAAPGRPPLTFTVVGRSVLNASGVERTLALGTGALVDWSAVRPLLGPDGEADFAPESWLVKIAPDAHRTAVLGALRQAFPSTVTGPLQPADVETLSEVTDLPVVFPVLVALLGIGTIVHALISSVRRRQHDLAILKTIGFTRRQLASVITTQATTFAAIALVVGIPLGIALGRSAWSIAANGLGVATRATIPFMRAGAGCIALVAVAIAAAVVPASMATRASVASVLQRD
jgi:ABC-type lipoprotein release transport system permease subunit